MTLWEAGDPAVESGVAPNPEPTADPDRTWTLPELGRAVKRALAVGVPSDVWVRGELRGVRPANRGGHRYFELVTPGTTPDARLLAKFSAVLFKRDAARVNARLAGAGNAARVADGVEVRVRARVEWWTPGGQLQLVITDIDPAFTLGRLEAQRAEVLAALQRDGLLDRNAKLPIPLLPLRVGLVTSRASAAHADFCHELAVSGYRFRVHLVDARMQGAGAPESIAKAITSLTPGSVDVAVVVRGGGARTDLATFDGAVVARAVATCPMPVLCGIGHEIDRTLTDLVAHTSAKTPTACAAVLVAYAVAAEEHAEELWAKVANRGTGRLARADQQLGATSARVARSGRRAARTAAAHTEHLAALLRTSAPAVPERASTQLTKRAGRVDTTAGRHLQFLSGRLDTAHSRLQALDPARLLARGWSITRDSDGAVVRSVTALRPGATLATLVADGHVTSTVRSLEPLDAVEDHRPKPTVDSSPPSLGHDPHPTPEHLDAP